MDIVELLKNLFLLKLLLFGYVILIIEEAVKNDRAYYLYLMGKAYNVEEEYNIKAEDYLSKAVKLNPNLINAWNHLGDSYFKKGEYAEAKNCFLNALNKVNLMR